MENLILVGVITGAHGIRGEVKLKSFTETPDSITAYGPLLTASRSRIEIEKLRTQKDGFIATLKNVRDRNAAEALKGTELYVYRAQLPETEKDEVYLKDLIGKPVQSNGAALGSIAGFQNYGAGELMELDSGLLIPIAFIASADEKISVSLPEGFLDTSEKPDE